MAAEAAEEAYCHLSEEIVDKLYLLGYDRTFLKQKSAVFTQVCLQATDA